MVYEYYFFYHDSSSEKEYFWKWHSLVNIIRISSILPPKSTTIYSVFEPIFLFNNVYNIHVVWVWFIVVIIKFSQNDNKINDEHTFVIIIIIIIVALKCSSSLVVSLSNKTSIDDIVRLNNQITHPQCVWRRKCYCCCFGICCIGLYMNVIIINWYDFVSSLHQHHRCIGVLLLFLFILSCHSQSFRLQLSQKTVACIIIINTFVVVFTHTRIPLSSY